MSKEEMRKFIWQQVMLLTVDMQYKKSQFLKGKYEAYKEMWEELGGDMDEVEQG